jgi:hypothetical protein
LLVPAVGIAFAAAALAIFHAWFEAKYPGKLGRWFIMGTIWSLLLAVVVSLARRAPTIVMPAPPDRRDILAASACVAVGILLFTLPDLISWRRTGHLVWVSDPDDLLYLAVGSQAYFNHPFHLSDPSRAEGGIPLYSWLPCVPGILLARLFDLGPVGIGLAWRLLAGAFIPLGWYLLLRRYLGPAPLTAALVLLLTADVGAMFGAPIYRQADVLGQIVRGDDTWFRGDFRPPGMQWRITTPGEIFLYYAGFLVLMLRAREAPNRSRLVAAGAAFGLLFYVYFYYWTAAALGLLLGAQLDRGRRRMYLHVAWIGVLIGLPTIAAGLFLKGNATDALSRFDLFVPVPRLKSLSHSIPETGTLALYMAWVWIRRRDLFPLATIAASGWVLVNHTLITGLQIQNDHWRLHIIGPMLTLLPVLIVLGLTTHLAGRSRRVACWALCIVSGLDVTSGFVIRAAEATSATGPRKQMEVQLRYRARRRSPGAARMEPNAVVAGDEGFVAWAMILDNQRMFFCDFLTRHSLTISNDEWNDRIALDGYLRGQDRATFEREQHRRIFSDWWGPWARDESLKAQLLARRMAAYDAVVADPRGALDRFEVRYAGLTAGSSPPDCPSCGWRLLEAGSDWWVWGRRPEPAATARADLSAGRGRPRPPSGPEGRSMEITIGRSRPAYSAMCPWGRM